MSEEVDVPAELPDNLEAAVQKIVTHTGYTRDEVIEKFVVTILDMADAPSGRIEEPDFLLTIKRALKNSDSAA
jgi:hypothetical protein